MKERPILFSGPMVRATLEGCKTQTRRIVKFPVIDRDLGCELAGCELAGSQRDTDRHSPYGQPGDRLWVRETWARNQNQISDTCMDTSYVYRADGETRAQDNGCDLPWRPSIHMPRAISRITLEITRTRVGRLHDISEEDARAEGAAKVDFGFARECPNGLHRLGFRKIWQAINGRESWALNPWVWVVEFRRVRP